MGDLDFLDKPPARHESWIKRRRNPWVIQAVIAGGLVVAAAVAAIVAIMIVSSRKDERASEEVGMYEAAKAIVLRCLKAPKTAEFEPYEKWVATYDKTTNRHHITSEVTAANAFSAKLTGPFSVILGKRGRDWEPLECRIDGHVVFREARYEAEVDRREAEERRRVLAEVQARTEKAAKRALDELKFKGAQP